MSAEATRRWRARHADRLRAEAQTPESIARRRAAQQRWRARNRERLRAASAQYHRDNALVLNARRRGRTVALAMSREATPREQRQSLREASWGLALAADPSLRAQVLALGRVASGVAKHFRARRPRHDWDDLYQVAQLAVIEAVAIHDTAHSIDEFAYIVAYRRVVKFLRGESRRQQRVKSWGDNMAALTVTDDRRRA